MAFTMTGAITGAAVAGLTSPTYTLTLDTAADDNTRQSAVTALGGTQTGVTTHAVSSPFTVTVSRPRTFKVIGRPNLNGLIQNVGRNTIKQLVRRGTIPMASQPSGVSLIRTDYEIVAGSEVADIANVKALISLNGGFTYANADGVATTIVNGLL